jgi:hypothetical protein
MRAVFLMLFAGVVLVNSAYAALWIESGSRGKEGIFIKSGDFPKGRSQRMENADVYMLDSDNKVEKGYVDGSEIKVNMPENGSYFVYLESKKVKDGVLHVTLSKTRVHNRKGSLAKSLPKEIRGKSESQYDFKASESVPMDIIMHRPIKQHHINCCVFSGDIARFELYFDGKLRKDIPLHVSTQYGWSKRVEADKEGMLSFEVPRDSYVDASKERRSRESMLVEGVYEEDQNGTYNDMPYTRVRYSMTQMFTFFNAPMEYASQLPAYLTVMGVMVAFSLGLFYMRRRRRREHKEIWFEEN